MTDQTQPSDPIGSEATLFPKTVGERLRAARLAHKLELTDIAQRTRVPLRQLQAIEDDDYSVMPTPTYAIGFAKAYARAVGEDEVEIAREVRGRAEVSAARRPEFQPYETFEAPRTPSPGVMVGGIALAVLLIVAAGLWFGTSLFRGDGLDSAPAPVETAAAGPVAAGAVPTPVPASQVTLMANDQVWMRIYDGANNTLLQKTMQPGERYDVPANAANPMINVGRPDKLQVLLNGSAVPPLGDGKVAIKDVGVSAAALQARSQPPAPPAVQPSAKPSALPTLPSKATAPSAATPSPTPSRSVPAAFRSPPARPAATSSSTGQREVPPAAATPLAPAVAPTTTAPGNGT